MSNKVDMLRIGLSLMTHIEPIIKEVMEIKGLQTHGKQELIENNGKFYAIYREFFESESDAKHFVEFCNRCYTLKKDQLPPIHIMIMMFKALLPILSPKELKGKQAHGKPEIILANENDKSKFAVILKESFTVKEDAINHLQEAEKIKSMRI